MENESSLEPRRSLSVATLVLVGLAFLLPVFFVPISDVSFQFTKTLLALVGVVVLFLAFVLKTFRSGTMSLSVSFPFTALLLLPAAYLISSVFSLNQQLSLFGYQLDSDTFGFITLGVVFSLVVLLSVSNAREIFSVFAGLFAAGCAVLLFQAFQFFAGAPFPFPAFSAPTGNLVGTWNGLAVFLGLFVSLALVALESAHLSKVGRIVLNVALFAAVAVLMVVNFMLAWILVALIALALLVYSLTRSFSTHASGAMRGMRGASAGLVLIIALFFIFVGGNVSAWLQNSLTIQALEVRPSLQGTLAVVESVYGTNPFFGTGPNTFAHDWFLYRQPEIVTTPFWDVAFTAGFASIPTAAVTGGILVALAWLLFIVAFVTTAVRVLLTMPGAGDKSYFLVVASAVGSLYLLVMHLAYVPEPVLTLLMFLFFGLFMSSVRGSKFSKDVSISFLKNPRLGFVSILAIIILAVVALASLYGAGALYSSTIQNQKAIANSFAGNLDTARAEIISAISLSEQDRYYRTLTAIELGRMNNLVSGGTSGADAQKEFTDILTAAINSSGRAITLNSASYQNWLSRASVFAAVAPLGIEGAYDSAAAALAEARKYNPGSPEIDFRLAQMKATTGDSAEARTLAEASLKKKTDYTQAILLLAQLSLNEGRLNDAIASVQSAVILEPQNSQLLYQLGLLKLQAGEYAEARDAFEKALTIDPIYANASFYLGASYLFLGQPNDALKQFESLLVKNPDNETLKSVLELAKRGENPFAPNPAASDIKAPTE